MDSINSIKYLQETLHIASLTKNDVYYLTSSNRLIENITETLWNCNSLTLEQH